MRDEGCEVKAGRKGLIRAVHLDAHDSVSFHFNGSFRS